jgi:cytochrome P450
MDTLPLLREAPFSDDLDWPAGLSPFAPFDRAIQTDPVAHYRWLRENAPIVRAGDRAAPLYIVSRFAEVTEGLRDATQFQSQQASVPILPGFLLNIDPPDHTRLRKAASSAFSPRAIATLEPRITALVRERWQAFLDQGGGDAMGSFASPLTIGVISSVLGVPVEHSQQMRDWTTQMLDYLATLMRGVPATEGIDDRHYRALTDYMSAVLDRALDSPQEDVVGNFARLRADGSLTPDETTGFLTLLFSAGHETTTLLTGNCIDFLCDNPEWLEFLRQPDGPAQFLGEMLRYRPPVHRLTRFTHRDAQLAGYLIPAGSSVRFLIGSANRDDSVFPDPDRFDPARANAAHAAFGYGMHMCMGSWLARLEVRTILETIGASVAHIERDPAIPRVPLTGGAFATVGLAAFGVRVTAR